LITSKYRSITVAEYIKGQAVEPFVILRNDVDRKPRMENEPFDNQEKMSLYY
jgi:hypothetical protein